MAGPTSGHLLAGGGLPVCGVLALKRVGALGCMGWSQRVKRRGGGLLPWSSSLFPTTFWCRTPKSPKILDLNLTSRQFLNIICQGQMIEHI